MDLRSYPRNKNTTRVSTKKIADISYMSDPELPAYKKPTKPVSSKKRRGVLAFQITVFIVQTIIIILLVVAVSFLLNIVLNTQNSYGGSCSSNSNCLSSIGLVCTSDRCSCPQATYFTGVSCDNQFGFNTLCSFSKQCDSSNGLDCNSQNHSCVCNTASYWNGTTCLATALLVGNTTTAATTLTSI